MTKRIEQVKDVREVVLVEGDALDASGRRLVLSRIGDVVMVRVALEDEENKDGVTTRKTVVEMFVATEAFQNAIAGLGFTKLIAPWPVVVGQAPLGLGDDHAA